jgi:hypothetical protein
MEYLSMSRPLPDSAPVIHAARQALATYDETGEAHMLNLRQALRIYDGLPEPESYHYPDSRCSCVRAYMWTFHTPSCNVPTCQQRSVRT